MPSVEFGFARQPPKLITVLRNDFRVDGHQTLRGRSSSPGQLVGISSFKRLPRLGCGYLDASSVQRPARMGKANSVI